ncbi:hypothetical protein DFH06DRAFT_1329211 [Mycena polygramma]|nr:hypothetical protein DFH06DRAFT_1329211 [Mycena polygramma]
MRPRKHLDKALLTSDNAHTPPPLSSHRPPPLSMQLPQPAHQRPRTPVRVYDLDEIMANLSLDDERPRTRPRIRRPTQTPRQPDIVRTPPSSPPAVPPSSASSSSRPLYRVQSPNKVVYTEHWSEAANASQGTLQAQVKAVRRRAKRHPPRAAYVVFRGRRIGVFKTWAAVEQATKHFPCAIYQGYANEELAAAAFALAQRKGWTYMSNSPTPAAFPRVAPLPIVPGEDPSKSVLSSRDDDDPYYVVYVGINPGVFATYVECALNVLGLPSAVHDRVPTYDEAVSDFRRACRRGECFSLRAPA